MSTVTPALVIFDCDGVLVDSDPIQNRMLAEAIVEAGLPITYEEVCRDYTGGFMGDIVASVEAQLGRELPEDWVPAFRARTAEAFRRDLEPVAGVERVLQQLTEAKIPFCVGSNGPLEKSHLTLGITGLDKYFIDRIFSGWQVPRGKPAPDLYLHAASVMGQPPSASVVIEDSVTGITAGIAAEMTTYGYVPNGDGRAQRLAGARVFRDMAELPALLGLA